MLAYTVNQIASTTFFSPLNLVLQSTYDRTYRLAGQAFEPLAFFKRSFIKKSASRAEVPTNGKPNHNIK